MSFGQEKPYPNHSATKTQYHKIEQKRAYFHIVSGTWFSLDPRCFSVFEHNSWERSWKLFLLTSSLHRWVHAGLKVLNDSLKNHLARWWHQRDLSPDPPTLGWTSTYISVNQELLSQYPLCPWQCCYLPQKAAIKWAQHCHSLGRKSELWMHTSKRPKG